MREREEEEGREMLRRLDNRGTMSSLPVLQRKQPNHCSQTEKCLSAYFHSFVCLSNQEDLRERSQ